MEQAVAGSLLRRSKKWHIIIPKKEASTYLKAVGIIEEGERGIGGCSYKSSNEFEPSFQVYDSVEEATKWDPVGRKTSYALKQVFGRPILNQRTNTAPVISALEVELEHARSRINELETEHRSSKKEIRAIEQARSRINELETEHHSSKKKLEQFLRKLSDERATWRKSVQLSMTFKLTWAEKRKIVRDWRWSILSSSMSWPMSNYL